MLSDSLKLEIQEAYSSLLSNKGYKARYCQKAMIAEIAKTLGNLHTDQLKNPALDPANDPINQPADEGADEGAGDSATEVANICVVEAGTGTGKTIAYAIAAIPMAKLLGKKIVIATATVALQEQIVYQDLPDIRAHSGLNFSFALAKGRRRYLCLSRFDLALQESASMNHSLDLIEQEPVDQSDAEIYEAMLAKLGRGDWDGDRDNWPVELEVSTWQRISTDHAQCTGRQCSHYENCFFYRARESIHRVDCIVTNHDLVLADLMMGGGAVLPDPEDAIYIFDEGHHLPEKAASHFSHFLAVYSTRSWLQSLPNSIKLAAAEQNAIQPGTVSRVEQQVEDSVQLLDAMAQLLQGLHERAEVDQDGWRYRFPLGVVDKEIVALCVELAGAFGQLETTMSGIGQSIEFILEDASGEARESAEHWLSAVSSAAARLDTGSALWSNFTARVDAGKPPYARWVDFTSGGAVEGMEIQLSSSPISVAEELNERLWSRCFAALVTSATLSIASDFSNFQIRAGIPPENRFVTLPSPFNFPEQGTLRIPKMNVEPNLADEHTANIAEILPGLLSDDAGSLVLFTSWRQMLAVLDMIDEGFRERVLCQGNFSKMEIISQHKSTIDQGGVSSIFGLASFAEGIDLSGAYCSHVVIAKIPFSVPNDPISATLSEWIENRGGNAFYEVSVPEAALRMIQACGRLLRTETDTGVVTILDRRLITKSYGKQILGALPPFRHDIE